MIRFSIPVLIASLFIAAQPASADVVHDRIAEGINYLYNVEFDNAAKSFDAAIAAAPTDPRGYFYRANVHLWSYLFDQRQDQLAVYIKASDRAIEVAERRIAVDGSDATAKMFLGMLYGYKTIANARAENFMAAAVSAKTCYSTLTDVISDNPKLYDAYLGVGIFHFVLGSVPKAGQVFAGMSGLRGDAQLGLREIETTARKGDYFRLDAQLIHAMLLVYYKDNVDQGLSVLEGMSKRYPRNIALLYSIGSVYLDRSQPDRAVEYFDRVTHLGNSDFSVFTALSYGRAGIAFFTKNDFPKAKTYLQKFLRLSDDKTLQGFAWYMLGVCLEMEGDRANAVKAYERSVKSPRFKSPEDIYGSRKARELIKAPLTATDIAVLKAINYAGAKQFDQAIALSRGVIAQSNATPGQRAQAYYALGQSLQGKNDCNGAIDAFTRATTVGRHTEAWVSPYSCYHIAECYLKMGDKKKWREYIDRTGEYHGYDNEPQLRFKLSRDVTLID